MGSGKQKKKPRVMTYYIMINKHTLEYFVNKSTKPQVSVRHHFHRAFNPERADYNSAFSQAMRRYGTEGFEVLYSLVPPTWMERRAHYMEAIPNMTLQDLVAGVEVYQELEPEANTPKKPVPRGSYYVELERSTES